MRLFGLHTIVDVQAEPVSLFGSLRPGGTR
jgi:hypothetical protein